MVANIGTVLDVPAFINHVRLVAPSLNLDPAAALAVSTQEGISGRIGDNGHAFGPFQLNDAGGSFPTALMYLTQQEKQAWAWSVEGIDYALGQMSRVAGGLTGTNAIIAIATNFERPRADLLPGEISGATAQYPLYSVGEPQITTNPDTGQLQVTPSVTPSVTTAVNTPIGGGGPGGSQVLHLGPFTLPSGVILVMWAFALLIVGALLTFTQVIHPTVKVNMPQRQTT